MPYALGDGQYDATQTAKFHRTINVQKSIVTLRTPTPGLIALIFFGELWCQQIIRIHQSREKPTRFFNQELKAYLILSYLFWMGFPESDKYAQIKEEDKYLPKKTKEQGRTDNLGSAETKTADWRHLQNKHNKKRSYWFSIKVFTNHFRVMSLSITTNQPLLHKFNWLYSQPLQKTNLRLVLNLGRASLPLPYLKFRSV